MADKRSVEELDDLKHKAKDAANAASHPQASARDKADQKILEQQAAAKKLEVKHGDAPSKPGESKLDKALKDTFPGSDPVSLVQAAPAPKPQR
jgi:hypothetical protein